MDLSLLGLDVIIPIVDENDYSQRNTEDMRG